MLAEEPFVASPVGSEPAARVVAETLADRVGLPRPTLIRAAMNATYAAGAAVIRVGRPTAPASTAYELADAMRNAGIRAPRPHEGRPVVEGEAGLVATAWERIVPVDDVDWRAVGEMVAVLHTLEPAEVAPHYPTPLATTFPWWRFDETLARAEALLDRTSFESLSAAVSRNDGWVAKSGGTAGWVLCHGDIHPHNVVADADGPVLLDWDLLCVGPRAWDHAPMCSMTACWGADPAWYVAFAEGYGTDLSRDPVGAALTELRLVAATLMRVLAEGPDRRPDSEAERRLRYWRGDPGAPTWRVV